MINGNDLLNASYEDEAERYFSENTYTEAEVDELMERAFSIGYDDAEVRMFGTASKIGAILSPAGWEGKELERLEANDEEEYKRKRLGGYLRGSMAPLTTSAKYRKAHQMAERGASPEEIRKALGHAGAGAMIGERVLNGVTFGASDLAGHGYGYYKGFDTYDSNSRHKAKARTKGKWED